MASRKPFNSPSHSQSGIAIFMVLAALTMLTMLATEFTYVSQVNRKMAADNLDQMKAYYLAKAGLKLSLLRLKIYKSVKKQLNAQGKAVASAIPNQLIEQIWKFPFQYPIPTELLGLSGSEKKAIDEFSKKSTLEGEFVATIESESNKFNVNMILSSYAPKVQRAPPKGEKPDDKNKKPTAAGNPDAAPDIAPDPSKGDAGNFDPKAARENFTQLLKDLMRVKSEKDESFAAEYADFKLDELTDRIFTWSDVGYEPKYQWGDNPVPPKRAPIYSITELYMIPYLTDELYDLFSPSLTAIPTQGLNVNSMTETTLRALVSGVTDEEVKEFFKFRDSPEENNHFNSSEDFYKYLLQNFSIFKGDSAELEEFKKGLQSRGITLITEEVAFKVVVESTVQQSTKRLEAWVLLDDDQPAAKSPNTPPAPGDTSPTPNPAATTSTENPAGMRITFMRIL